MSKFRLQCYNVLFLVLQRNPVGDSILSFLLSKKETVPNSDTREQPLGQKLHCNKTRGAENQISASGRF